MHWKIAFTEKTKIDVSQQLYAHDSIIWYMDGGMHLGY